MQNTADLQAEIEQLRSENMILRRMVAEFRDGVHAETQQNLHKYEKHRKIREMWARIREWPVTTWNMLPTVAQNVLCIMGGIFAIGSILDTAVRLYAWWLLTR